MRRTILTDGLVRTLPLCREGKHSTVRDTVVEGLTLVVRDDRKTFYYLPRGEQPSRIRVARALGVFPDVGTDYARGIARMLQQADKSESYTFVGDWEAVPTFASVAEAYAEAAPYRKLNRSAEADQKFVRRNFVDPQVNPFATKPVDQITDADISELIEVLRRRGPQLARTGFARLKTLFNWAMRPDRRRRFRLTSNPAAHLSARDFGLRYKCRTRELSSNEFRLYLTAIDRLPNSQERAFATALALTGLRGNDLLKMRWSELDLDRKVWTSSQMIREFEVEVPLSDATADLLTGLRDTVAPDAGAFVFGERRPPFDLPSLKRRIDEAMEIVRSDMDEAPIRRWVFMDIRRTVYALLISGGLESEAANLAIGRGLSLLRFSWNLRPYAEAIRVALNQHAENLAALKDGSQVDLDG